MANKNAYFSITTLLMLITLGGCSYHSPQTPPNQAPIQDGPPKVRKDMTGITDAIPKPEALARYGNHSPYTVLGKTYEVMPSSEGYQREGIASWYGEKFSGRPTSSFEPYDPYAMTAAHKTLPLPTYVKVTNLENQKTVVVKVNDRGPFHDDRIIDLSYAAASKLGYMAKGTARVHIEVIATALLQPAPKNKAQTTQKPKLTFYLQVAALSKPEAAQKLENTLKTLTDVPVYTRQTEQNTTVIHRVQIGPFENEQSAITISERIKDKNIAKPLLMQR